MKVWYYGIACFVFLLQIVEASDWPAWPGDAPGLAELSHETEAHAHPAASREEGKNLTHFVFCALWGRVHLLE